MLLFLSAFVSRCLFDFATMYARVPSNVTSQRVFVLVNDNVNVTGNLLKLGNLQGPALSQRRAHQISDPSPYCR